MTNVGRAQNIKQQLGFTHYLTLEIDDIVGN